MIQLLAVAASLACAQTAVPEELRDAVADFQSKYAPARIDKAPVAALFARLSRDSHYEKAEGDNTIAVELYELPLRQPEGWSDALYRRAFSHMTAEEQILRKKDKEVDVWQYDIGLSGTLEAVRRLTVKLDDKGVPLEQGSRLMRMSPSDPSIQARWKKLAPRLLKLGKTYEA